MELIQYLLGGGDVNNIVEKNLGVNKNRFDFSIYLPRYFGGDLNEIKPNEARK